MITLYPNNPDHALTKALSTLTHDSSQTHSRNGPVLRFKTPVTTAWVPGFNRISTDPLRDANPFLHYIESFWMLAGADDVATVAKLAANMANYSDDGLTLHGAYGKRWRSWFDTDQISDIITELKCDRSTRRCVLQMWDGYEDLAKATTGGKDVPCNTVIYFDPLHGELNMTVSNRSNDLVWGAYGANVVHMSILHEYVSVQTGFRIGTYYQVSNNLHLYLDNPVTKKVYDYDGGRVLSGNSPVVNQEILFDYVRSDALFVDEVKQILSKFLGGSIVMRNDQEPVWKSNLVALANGFNVYKTDGAKSACDYLSSCTKSQWIDAAIAWLKRRPSYAE